MFPACLLQCFGQVSVWILTSTRRHPAKVKVTSILPRQLSKSRSVRCVAPRRHPSGGGVHMVSVATMGIAV